MLSINSNTSIYSFKEGLALFNGFSGDTHFLSPPYDAIITSLTNSPQPKEQLFSTFCELNDLKSEEFQDHFQQFVSEAINSGIILEK
ncbi:HPr-rel-A system PqqD family peptide chaperone [Colwelliaceae bacterium 6471]